MTTAWAGERIRTVRHLLGISQDQLADAAGVSQALISAVESGNRQATEDLIAAVQTATATPRSFFDVAPMDLSTGTLRFRKLTNAKRSDTRRTETLVQEAYRIAGDLLRGESYRLPSLPQTTETVLSDDVIEGLAVETRDALGIDADAPVVHVTRLLERGGIAVAPLVLPGADVHPDDAVGHFGASLWASPAEHPLVGYFPTGAGDRQRFTLAHELGHLVLHLGRPRTTDPELEAHRFAGAFLLPRERMNEALGGGVSPLTLRDLAQMKARWGVSIQAIIMRGSHLGLIDSARKVSLYKQLSARGWRRYEPVSVAHEKPELLRTLLERRYGPNPYRHAEEPLGIQTMVLRSLAPAA